MPDENLDIVIEAKAEGEHQIRDLKDSFDDLRRSVLEASAAIVAALPAQAAATTATSAASAATKGWTQSMGDFSQTVLKAIPFVGDFLASFGEIPVIGPVVVTVVLAVAAAVAVLVVNLTILAGGAATILTAVALGFTSIATAATLALGPIAAIGAAVVILGIAAAGTHDLAKATTDLEQAQDRYNVVMGITKSHAEQVAKATEDLAAAQKTYNDALAFSKTPLGQFEKGLDDLKTSLGQQALPLLQQMASFGNTLLPIVGQLGSQLISWFGERLPLVLSIANSAIGPLLEGARQLGTAFGYFIDQILAEMPILGPMFKEMLGAGVEAVKGFLDNLLRFVHWFEEHWPELKPIAKEVMDKVGEFIQNLGKRAGELVDWFIKNWPEIKHTISDLMPVLDKVGPAISSIGLAMLGIMKATEDFIAVMGWVRDRVREVAGAVEWVIRALDFLDAHRAKIHIDMSDLTAATNVLSSSGGSTGGHIISGQSGMVVPGPFGAPRLVLAHAGEEILPAARTYLGDGGGGGNTYNITVNVPTAANLADVGRETVRAIQQYERAAGSAWRK